MNQIGVQLLLGVLGIFAVPLLTIGITSFLRVLTERANIDLTREQSETLNDLARQAAMATEEWAAAKLKATAGKTKVTPDDKLAHAVALMSDRVSGLTEKRAIDMIKGALPSLGFGAVVR